jgi:UDP-3-O-[3-hydroxymyristoyl] N-acetylglucosamine deacetylase
MDRRQTIASVVALQGIGLHSGRQARLRLLPAEARTGIVFVRTDAHDARIPATLAHLAPSRYATVLECAGQRVGTVEHLMAALSALRVDDLIVELDGPEPPILDGSSLPFVEAIARAGLRPLEVEREYLTLTRTIEVSEEDKRISAHPWFDFRVTYAIDFEHPLLGYQDLSVSVWREDDFRDKLAAARTFTFEDEVAELRRRGLALGGSLDNALVLGRDKLLNPDLRFADEFVRHKILDLTGDLALLGHPLRAHVVAYRAGHDLHTRLARRILEARDSWYLAPWGACCADRPSARP